jgi:DNA-binding LacI/PurR family transcriptional regulator
MPPVRALVKRHGAAKKTVEKALRSLASQGLLAAVPRQGFRVLHRAADPDRGLPLAYVANAPGADEPPWDEFHQLLLAAFRQVAAARGWSLLVVSAGPGNTDEVMGQVRSAGVFGAILDLHRPELLAAMRAAGLPAVVVDVSAREMPADCVVQDSFMGGLLAGTHLVERGARRPAWFGAEFVHGDLQIIERYAGAAGALWHAGRSLDPDLTVRTPLGNPGLARERAREEMTAALVLAARDADQVPGRDFEMVGWSTQEAYRSGFVPQFGGGPAPPCVTWSVGEMAGAALRLLRMRRTEPDAPPAHVRIPTRLTPGSES